MRSMWDFMNEINISWDLSLQQHKTQVMQEHLQVQIEQNQRK